MYGSWNFNFMVVLYNCVIETNNWGFRGLQEHEKSGKCLELYALPGDI